MNRKHLGTRAMCVAVTIGVVSLAVPAQATVIDRLRADDEPYEGWYECGATYHVEGLFSGHLILKQGTGPKAQTFPVLDNFAFEEIHTNTATGKTFTVSANGVFNEVKSRPVEGTVVKFQAVEAGQPLVVRDGSGRIVLRDRGAVVFTYLFDTLGDSAPGGDYVSDWDASVRGARPSYDVDWCEMAEALTQ